MTLRDRLHQAAQKAEKTRRLRNEYPPLAVQALSFGKAMGRAAGAIATCGELMVDDEERERRLQICEACDRFERVAVRCKECGCLLKAKLRMATEGCPLSKWGQDHES